ncbi:hypothetical protein lpa_03721 [Legionella pneumophila 2300/99 Alcoy]|nr:hypothetical protein lpa_03721 [Legionella pneumophila 2300/99 Alcoy]
MQWEDLYYFPLPGNSAINFNDPPITELYLLKVEINLSEHFSKREIPSYFICNISPRSS